MKRVNKEQFLELVKAQFRPEDRHLITEESDLTCLREWSSLQTMILLSEIDKNYQVLLAPDEMKAARSAGDLFNLVNNRLG